MRVGAAVTMLAFGCVSMLVSSCETAPPPPPEPPPRVELTFQQWEPAIIGYQGVYVNVTTRRPEIVPRSGYEHCEPRVESWSADKTASVGPAYPDEPGREHVIRDVWHVRSARAVFSVPARHPECWDEALWATEGQHPYHGTWLLEGAVREENKPTIRPRSSHIWLDPTAFTIVK